jgi:hypothetical protein
MGGVINIAKKIRYIKGMGVTHIDTKQEIHKIDRLNKRFIKLIDTKI